MKIELEQLYAIVPPQSINSHKILDLLKACDRNEVREIEFEIKRDKIYLTLLVIDGLGEFTFRTSGYSGLEQYLLDHTKFILEQLGYDSKTWKKQMPNFKSLDKVSILEEMSIIYIEVFGIVGQTLTLRIK